MTSYDRTDVVIVGGGIVGCATAYNLARKGLSVRVIERGPIGGEQSSRAWGFVRQQGRHPAEAEIAALASQLWSQVEAELQADVEYVRSGIVLTAETDMEVARLEGALRAAQERGVPSRRLQSGELETFVPGYSKPCAMAILTETDGNAEPAKATAAFARKAKELGVQFNEHMPVLGVEVTNGSATGVTTPDRVFHADAVIAAAGIGTADLSRSVGLSLPIEPVRAPVAQTNPTTVTSRTAVWAPHVAFRPKRDGSFYIGNGYREIDAEVDVTLDSFRHLGLFWPTFKLNCDIVRIGVGATFLEDIRRRFDAEKRARPWSEPKVNERLIRRTEQHFYETFPHLAGLGLARCWAGRIDATPDLIPIVGEVGPKNYYVAAGFNGHGFTLSPAIGKLLAELVVDGRSSLDLRALRFSRYAEGEGKPLPDPL